MREPLTTEESDCLSLIGRWCQIASKKGCQIAANLTVIHPRLIPDDLLLHSWIYLPNFTVACDNLEAWQSDTNSSGNQGRRYPGTDQRPGSRRRPSPSSTPSTCAFIRSWYRPALSLHARSTLKWSGPTGSAAARCCGGAAAGPKPDQLRRRVASITPATKKVTYQPEARARVRGNQVRVAEGLPGTIDSITTGSSRARRVEVDLHDLVPRVRRG